MRNEELGFYDDEADAQEERGRKLFTWTITAECRKEGFVNCKFGADGRCLTHGRKVE